MSSNYFDTNWSYIKQNNFFQLNKRNTFMIDFTRLTFTRICIHKIDKKRVGNQHAFAECDNQLTNLGTDVEDTLRERLQAAFAHRSRSLELEIADCSANTFFDLCKDLQGTATQTFIDRSVLLANALASAQTNSGIPGGYFILIDALDEGASPVAIVIKAEPHEAFKKDSSNGSSRIDIIKDLFLSPGTKLYKIVALFKRNDPEKTFPNDIWGCLLFDEQYTPGDRPSSYFWDNFLKLSIDNNAKVQTAMFYKTVRTHIEKSDIPLDEKTKAYEGLDTLILDSYAQTIDPNIVKETLFAPDHRAAFSQKVQSKFPRVIAKDISAIEKKLETHLVYFPNGVKLSGDKTLFNRTVKSITNPDEIRDLSYDPNKTILVIEGKPSRTKQ